MNRLLLKVISYFIISMITVLIIAFFQPQYWWVVISLIAISALGWAGKKRWISYQSQLAQSLVLEEDFIP